MTARWFWPRTGRKACIHMNASKTGPTSVPLALEYSVKIKMYVGLLCSTYLLEEMENFPEKNITNAEMDDTVKM